MAVYNNIDIKPIKYFLYIKECYVMKNFFYKNINFLKKTRNHMWWILEKFKNTNICFVPNFFSSSKMQIIINFSFKKILYKSACGCFLIF